MPATISQSGTWTTLAFDRTVNPKTGPNTRELEDLNLTAFNSGLTRGPSPNLPELDAFIQLVADAYSITNGSATTLVKHFMAMKGHRGEPVAREFTP